MTIRTFWTITIKIMGIWFVINNLMFLLQFFTSIFFLNGEGRVMILIATLGMILLTLFIFILIFYFFIFKTDWIIDKLMLDKGFQEEKFDLTIHRSTILSIAAIIVGGLIVLDALPQLFRQIILYFQQQNPTSTWIIFYFVKFLLGYIILTNSRLIVNLIEHQRKK
jgi:hypothetical protein